MHNYKNIDMIRAVIIDDESWARQSLSDLINRELHDTVNVLGDADDIGTGIALIKKHKPDLVFLDIKMHEGTGFDLLQQLDTINFEVIFVTAYDEFAIKAIQFSAFGYLLKPVKLQEIKDVVNQLEIRMQDFKPVADRRVKVLIENYGDDRKIKKLIINHLSGFDVSLVEDIIRLEGDGNYTNFIITNDRKVMTSRTLGEYEELLFDHGFYRVHQSTIVNLRHVVKYHKGTGGKVEMSDGKLFNVSRYRKAGFLEYFLGNND
ncbi:MAG: two-component system LytT family response regulator [Crocinitomix sp.]|jgi:two-component system LytT family response regulator